MLADIAKPGYYLGRAFHEERAAAEHAAFHECGHVFTLGRESELVYHSGFGAEHAVIHAFAMHPQQQGTFGWVAHAAIVVFLFEVCG